MIETGNLNPQQATVTDEAYQRAVREWEASDKTGDLPRFFFLAGAQLGLELAKQIERKVFAGLIDDDNTDDDPTTIFCSKCGAPTSWDSTYGDLCYRCVRAKNE